MTKTKDKLEEELAKANEELVKVKAELEQYKVGFQQAAQRIQAAEAENKFLFESLETLNSFRKERDLATQQLQRGKKQNVQTKNVDRGTQNRNQK